MNFVLRYNINNNMQERKTQKILNYLFTLSTTDAQSGDRALQHIFRTFCVAIARQIQEHKVFQPYRKRQQIFAKRGLHQSPQVFRTPMPSSRLTRNLMPSCRVTGWPIHLLGNT